MVVKGELTPNKNNQQKEQEMKNINKKKQSSEYSPPFFGLMALLTCTFLATSATAGSGGRLVGLLETEVTVTNCQGVTLETLEAHTMYHQDGTLNNTDTKVDRSGLWNVENLGGGAIRPPFVFSFTRMAPIPERA